jgi:predicted ArsR family transcriptional regulator
VTEPSDTSDPDELAAITSLAEPTRRALYDYVADHGSWVSRDAAAEAVGLERGTAAHHLERLASDGLLDVDYQRLTGRQGPGAGRPAKLYRRARREFDVSLPPRDYELAGRLLADAADTSRTEHTDITTALDRVSTAEGHELGRHIRDRLHGVAGRKPANRRRATLDAVTELGYEPSTRDDGTVVLRNCPFHQLAKRHTELICGMNQCLLDTAIDDVGNTGLRATLDPEDGLCCVKLRPTR